MSDNPSDLWGFPGGFVFPGALGDPGGGDDQEAFLSLPEDAQQEILKQHFSSGEEFHDCLEDFLEKE